MIFWLRLELNLSLWSGLSLTSERRYSQSTAAFSLTQLDTKVHHAVGVLHVLGNKVIVDFASEGLFLLARNHVQSMNYRHCVF